MAAAANHSPRNSGSGDASAALNSPQSKRGAAARGIASPWAHVVRGAEPEPFVSSSSASPAAAAAAAPSSPSASAATRGQINNYSLDWSPSKEAATAAGASSSSSLSSPDDSAPEGQTEISDTSTGSSNAAKKQVWNKPSNGAAEVGPVMGAVSWPALSESTRASPKSFSSDSLKALPDGSFPISQGTGIVSSTMKQVITNNTNLSLTPNHVTPSRQKPMKRGSGSSSGNISANGGFPQPPPPPLAPVVEVPPTNTGKSGLAVPESSPRDHTYKESGQKGGFGSQSHSGNDHPQQRNQYRRGNGGPYPRGDGSYHHGYGGRRDQDRGNHEWNSHRNVSGRDAHMHPQRVLPRGYIRPQPHSSTPFIPPPPVPMRPFVNPMGYPEVPSPVIYVSAPPQDSLRGMPVVAQMQPHAIFFPMMDPQLHTKIVNQIDYYFSNENLIKDTYLRQNMDDQGWVPINLIAGFKKVQLLTDNIPLILDALRTSSVVEVQDDRIRKRDDWWRWIMPPSVQFPTVSSPQSLGRSSHDMLAANMRNVSLEEKFQVNE
ncbi:hypothetical protein U1Q18_040052 [Sarracenia purpurea var. burkii]